MKLLFCSRPAYGHLYPMMPLAMAAWADGHDVVFATGGRFPEMLRGLGFRAVAIGISSEEGRRAIVAGESTVGAVPGPTDGRPDMEFVARLFFDVLASRSADDLARHIDEIAPDVVVYDQAEIGSAVVAGANGIRAVCHAISPRMPVAAVESLAREYIGRLWSRYGVDGEPPFDVFDGDAYLDIVPSSLQHPSFLDHPHRIQARPTPWAEPDAALPSWVGARSRPLVYVTLGTAFGRTDNLAPAVEGLARLEADVLVALGSATDGRLDRLPANVHVEGFVDQAALLPHADLVVHHGGTGTMLGSLAHGRRQVLLPKGADQFFNAEALVRGRMATMLEPAEATPDAIEAAARSALAAPVPDTALAVRDEIAAMPGPAEVLDDVLGRVSV